MAITTEHDQLAILHVTRVAISSLRHRASLSVLRRVTLMPYALRLALRHVINVDTRSSSRKLERRATIESRLGRRRLHGRLLAESSAPLHLAIQMVKAVDIGLLERVAVHHFNARRRLQETSLESVNVLPLLSVYLGLYSLEVHAHLLPNLLHYVGLHDLVGF